MLAFIPLLFSCNILDNVEHDGTIDIDSIGVANVDGSGFKMLAEGRNAQFTPDSKKIVFSNYEDGLLSIGIDGSSLTSIYKNRLINKLLVSPDGMRVAFISDSSQTIYLINTDGSGFKPLYQSKFGKDILYFSDDGSKLYFVENRSFSAVDLNGSCTVLSKSPFFGTAWDPQITPDGKGVLYFSYSGSISQLVLRNLNTQKDSVLVDCDYLNVRERPAKFISRNTFLYVYNHKLYSYDLTSGEKKSYITIPDGSNPYSDGSYYYSQDGQKIVYRKYFDKIEVADIGGDEKAVITVPESTSGLGPYQISPDSRKVTFISIKRKNVY